MVLRFLWGASLLLLMSYVGYHVWKKIPLSPQSVVEVSSAQDRHLDGKGIIVAVIDEGFDSSHTALKDKISHYRYNTNNNSRDVSETLIFEKGKYKFESHGTHVTGIISNFAPQVKVIPIKLGNFGGDQAFVKALHIAAESPAHIVNLSVRLSHTGREISPNVRKALIHLAQKGKLIVIAAGNDGIPLMNTAYTASLVELTFDPLINGRLLLVGASSYKNGHETLAEFSNYPGRTSFGMAQTYFIVAPGEDITSALTGGYFGEKSGTSMAAPIVVGTASLLKQAFPHLEADKLALLLLKSARRFSLKGQKLSRSQFGAGVVNFKSALEEGKIL